MPVPPPVRQHCNVSPSSATDTTSAGSDTIGTLPHKSSSLKTEGWSGFMRTVRDRGALVVTHHNEPQAVILSVERYQEMERLSRRVREREVRELSELRTRFDERLAILNALGAHQALNDFLDVTDVRKFK